VEDGRPLTATAFSPLAVIMRKRDGATLSDAELAAFIQGFVRKEVADYQMSAFLMAAFLRGLTGEETATLTRTMVETGRRLDLKDIAGVKVDKHSTGGVGDKISIPLAPLVAACGVPVPMISGRGLGHTGGTLDKLEAIPGFRTRLSADEFTRVLREVGYAMGGQTDDLAPADRRMYALRDVTGTVESIPLIVSSILSKKIAEGADALLLDVKHGRGAFMTDLGRATELARELVRVGGRLGLRTVAFLTDMDRPLGLTIGNALEIEESIDILKGGGPADVRELTVTFGAAMLVLGRAAPDFQAGRTLIEKAIENGSGLDRFRRLIELQGGDPRVIDSPSRLPRAREALPFLSPGDGHVSDLDPRRLAEAVVSLGGGRRRAEDEIDPAVGIRIHRSVGDPVSAGEPVLTLLGQDAGRVALLLEECIRPAVTVSAGAPGRTRLIGSVIVGEKQSNWDPSAPPAF
jgi:pyrimidine-nucleoside phosphorylase